MKYYIEFWKRAFDFKGVASRPQYWFAVLFNFIALFVLNIITMFIDSSGEVGSIVAGIYSLAMLIPSIAISVRRLHDQNKVGWFYLLGLIPAVGSIIIFIFMLLPTKKENNRWRMFDMQRGYVADEVITEPLSESGQWTYKE